jgi:Mycothiol maleylpyruvate isomerase N-terminal domain
MQPLERTGMDIQSLNRRAVLRSVEIASSVRDDQWELPTPCSRWTLRQLLQHMTAHNHGFAAAADGETSDASVWREQPLGDDPRPKHTESADRVITAFGADGVLGRNSGCRRFTRKSCSLLTKRSASTFSTMWCTAGTWQRRGKLPSTSMTTSSRPHWRSLEGRCPPTVPRVAAPTLRSNHRSRYRTKRLHKTACWRCSAAPRGDLDR